MMSAVALPDEKLERSMLAGGLLMGKKGLRCHNTSLAHIESWRSPTLHGNFY